MKALIQRVTSASVSVAGEIVGQIDSGLVALIGVTHDDDLARAVKLASKIVNLRVMDDSDGVMNLSVADTCGSVLAISQFTLYGDTAKGRRPSWTAAANPEVAEPLVQAVIDELRVQNVTVETGIFRAEMVVQITNDGPVTVMIEL
ncbi:MAG: D-aminoacyl-tRNA deacylase [Acidimicrobiales bacterium]